MIFGKKRRSKPGVYSSDAPGCIDPVRKSTGGRGNGPEIGSGSRSRRSTSFVRLAPWFAQSAELRNVLLSPAVSNAKKRNVIGRFADSLPLSRLVRNFLYVIVDRRRSSLLDDMADAFETGAGRTAGDRPRGREVGGAFERSPAIGFTAGVVASVGQAGPVRILDRSGVDRRRSRAESALPSTTVLSVPNWKLCASGWWPAKRLLQD